MKYLKICLVVSMLFISSCKKDSVLPSNNSLTANAEIIAFRADKCSCCWGWVIRMGVDTIKADSLPNPEAIGYSISDPIPVFVELAGLKQDCSSMPSTERIATKSYYTVKRLEIIK